MTIKETPSYIISTKKHLSHAAKLIAVLLSIILLGAAFLLIFQTFSALINRDTFTAIQDGLFVMITLEMLYVIFSFIKYGSINVSLVINVGIIAVVKDLVFQMKNINLSIALAFSVIIISLSIAYVVEMIVYEKKKKKVSEI